MEDICRKATAGVRDMFAATKLSEVLGEGE
jgi:hypothetical protein